MRGMKKTAKKVNGKLKRMSGFDEEHIKNQLWPRKATMIRKVKDA